MDNPGPLLFTYNGGNGWPLNAAGTYVGDWLLDLEGMLAASLQAQFQYGAGGTTIDVYFQTSFDQGQTAVDIAHVQFTTANGTEVANVSGLTPVTTLYTPFDAGLAANTVKDGLLSDRLRAKVVVTGTYTGQNLLHLTGAAR